jgi:uncharacterized RDD family membrane protein YckC
MTNDISGSDFASPNIQNEPKATFGIRLIAHIFDAVMVMLVSFPFAIVSTIVEENGSSSGADAITLLGIIVCLGVYSWWIGNQGGSPLRRTIGVLVLDERTGAFIGTKRGVKWVLMSQVSGIVLFLGYFAMLWHPNKQTWHDRVANAVVVKR